MVNQHPRKPKHNRQTLSLLSKSYQRRHDRCYGCRRRCTFWMIGLLSAIAVSISITTYNFHYYQYYHYTDPSMGNNNKDRSFVVNTLSSSLRRRSIDSGKNSTGSFRVTGASQQRRNPTREVGTSGGLQRIRLVHVISPFVEGSIDAAIENTKGDSLGGKLLYPLGLNQWTTMQSIKRALQQIDSNTLTTGSTDNNNNNNNNIDDNGVKVNNIDVTVLCTVFETDFEILSSPDAGLPCHKFVTLHRSTRTQYPPNTTKINLELPFISDMIDTAMSLFDGDGDGDETSSYHVMLTNSDIGLTPMFYTRVYEILQTVDSFSMNRMTIPLDSYHHRHDRQDLPPTSLEATSEAEVFYESLAEYIEQSMIIYDKNDIDPSSSSLLSKAISHPGYDLFCMSSTVLKRVTFGDMFLGRSPWGMNVHLLLQIMADSYVNIKSNSNGTFHLGDEKRWMEPDDNNKNDKGDSASDSTSSHDNVDEAVRKSFALFGFCPCNDDPATMRNMLAVQNNINCVHWFLGQAALANKSSNSSSPAFSSPAFVPGFVRQGWEEWYLHRTTSKQNDSSHSQGEHVRLIRDGIGRPTCRIEKLQQ